MCPDVCFLVKDEKIYAHKLVLARSIVFKNMFYNKNFLESQPDYNTSKYNNNNNSNGGSSDYYHPQLVTIDERECSVEAFLIFLKYMYIDKIVDNITLSNVIEVSNLANKYSINTLEYTCERYMSENCLNDDNIFSTFVHARLYNMKTLEMNSLRYILRNASRLLDSGNECNRLSSFYELSQDDLLVIISDNQINIAETTLFQAVLNWAVKQCERNNLNPSTNLGSVLGDLLYLIRYPLMDQVDFVKIVMPTRILSESDMLAITTYYITRDSSVLNNRFITTPRRTVRILILGGDRDERIENVRKLVEEEVKRLNIDVECVDKFNANKKMISKSKLFEYSAVLVFSNSSNFCDRVAMGDLLAEFVENNNGGLVITTFANSGGLSLKGKIADHDFCPCVLGSAQQDNTTADNPMVILDKTHPILRGIEKFSLGKYRCKSPFKATKDGKNRLLAVWPDDVPAIAVRTGKIRLAILNFFAVNNELITDSWNKNQPAGAQIILNSLLWTSYAI
jgi:hypothetical protein